MNFSHRNRNKEARDVWIRSFPLQTLNHLIFDSLSKSEVPNKAQSIRIAKLILAEIVELCKFNRDCETNGFLELSDPQEVKQYLKMFDNLFHRIISDSQWVGDSKSELIKMVEQYQQEGTVNFNETRVPNLLLKTLSPDQLEDILLDALLHPGQESKQISLLQVCSPGSPQVFQLIMGTLLNLFTQSNYHPEVMEYTRKFNRRLESHYKSKYLDLIPTYLLSFVLMYHQILPFMKEKSGESYITDVILYLFEEVYSPAKLKFTDWNQDTVSFYISATCPLFLPLLGQAIQTGACTYTDYPSLWSFLKSRNNNCLL